MNTQLGLGLGMEEFEKDSSELDATSADGVPAQTLNMDSSSKSKAKSGSNKPASNSDRTPVNQASRETATSYETAELGRFVEKQSKQATAPADQQPAKVRRSATQTTSRPSRPDPSKLKRAKKSPGKTSPFAIRTGEEDENDFEEEFTWESTYRGMPSWLTSLIIHLTIILSLALFSIQSGGSNIVSLLASETPTENVEDVDSFEFVLEPLEIEEAPEELESAQSKIAEATDLAPLLDEALLASNLDDVSSSDLFDSLSAQRSDEDNLAKQEAGGAKFFGVEGEGADFVFIVDCSGSMSDYGRWRQAVGELKSSIRGMKTDQKFLILLYNNGYVAMNDDAKLVKSTKRQQDRAFRWLSRKIPNNWTFCAEALAKALRLEPDAIFLLSDGEFNDRDEVFTVLEALNTKNKLKIYGRSQIPVHTIALGSHVGRFTMKRIADENAGNFKLIE